MRKTKLLNSEISYVISKMGHFDTLAIGDAGLPVPSDTPRIDLAVSAGIPSFMDVLDPVLDELCVQRVFIASEMKVANTELHKKLLTLFCEKKISVEEIPHEEFKKCIEAARAVVRTGETKPYANIILESGVIF